MRCSLSARSSPILVGLLTLRKRTAAIEPVPGTREVVESLRPRWWSGLQVGVDALTGAASERYRSLAGDTDVATLDELTGDDFSSATDERPTSVWLSPIALTMAVAVVASIVAARSLFGSGFLAGPALLPAHDSLASLWRTVVAAIPGAPLQITPPWEALTALGSTATFGQPEWFSTLLLCGIVPLSLLAAYPLARQSDQRPPRAALDLCHVRAAAGAPWRHESGPPGAQRGGHQPSAPGHGGARPGAAPDANPGSLARRLGRWGRLGRLAGIRAVHDHFGAALRRSSGPSCYGAAHAR